jgi:hypothetical protein
VTELYGRTASLVVLNRDTGLARTLEGLRVSFEIEKTSESTSNKAKIMIYNLNEDNRAFFESESLSVILSAGYKGIYGTSPIVQQLFSGDIIRTTTKKGSQEQKERSTVRKHLPNHFLIRHMRPGSQ